MDLKAPVSVAQGHKIEGDFKMVSALMLALLFLGFFAAIFYVGVSSF